MAASIKKPVQRLWRLKTRSTSCQEENFQRSRQGLGSCRHHGICMVQEETGENDFKKSLLYDVILSSEKETRFEASFANPNIRILEDFKQNNITLHAPKQDYSALSRLSTPRLVRHSLSR